jgi:hypothetical protein
VHFKDGVLPKAIEEGLVRVKRLPFGSSGLTGDYLNLRGALAGPLASGDVKLDNATLEDVLLSFIKGA